MHEIRIEEQQDKPREDPCRRRYGRLLQETLSCNYGAVLDLSATGMRTITIRPLLSNEMTVKIRGLSNELITVRCEVVWRKRRGLFKREIGLRFIDLDEHTAARLAALSRDNRLRRSM